MKKALITLSILSTLGLIGSAYASGITVTGGVGAAGAGTQAGTGILALLALAQTIVIRLVPFFIGLAVVVFFYFLIMFIVKGSESGEKRGEYLKGMGFAVIALFVMVSIWGLVGFLGSALGIGQGGTAPAPGIPVPQ